MLRVHHSTALAGSLGVIGLHAVSGRGAKILQINYAVTLPTGDAGKLLDTSTGFAAVIDGDASFVQESWGFSQGRISGADTIKSGSFKFDSGVIVQDLEIAGFTPSAADWFIFYEEI